MNKLWIFFDNLKLRNKFLFLFLLPGVIVVFFTAQIILTNIEKVEDAEKVKSSITLTSSINDVVHNLAIERGLSAAYLGQPDDASILERLSVQRNEVDARIDEFQIVQQAMTTVEISTKARDVLDSFVAILRELSEIRDSVNNVERDMGQFEYYSDAITFGIDSAEILVLNVKNADFVSRLNSIYATMWLKERAGQERGALAGAFASGNLSTTQVIDITGYITHQNDLLENHFYVFAEQQYVDQMLAVMTGEHIESINYTRQIFFSRKDKFALLNQMHNLIGYGGLIHNFKNYVLRQSPDNASESSILTI